MKCSAGVQSLQQQLHSTATCTAPVSQGNLPYSSLPLTYKVMIWGNSHLKI